jgi:hypothetical protein
MSVVTDIRIFFSIPSAASHTTAKAHYPAFVHRSEVTLPPVCLPNRVARTIIGNRISGVEEQNARIGQVEWVAGDLFGSFDDMLSSNTPSMMLMPKGESVGTTRLRWKPAS